MKAWFTSDTGSTLPLAIFYGFVSLSLIAVVVGSTSLYIERKRLLTIADGASLAGAEAFALSEVHVDGRTIRVKLSNQQVRDAAIAYVRDAQSTISDVQLVSATSPDGVSARVRLSSQWQPPLLSELIDWSLRIEVTSTARSVFG